VMLILVVIESVLSFPHIVNKLPGYLSKQMIEIEQNVDAKMKKEGRIISDEAKAKTDMLRNRTRPVAVAIGCAATYMGAVLSVLFCFGAIYYFTRPQILKRFDNRPILKE